MTATKAERAQSLLAEHNIDALLVTNPTNRRYFTGFTADDHAIDEPSGVALVSPNGVILFAPATNLPWAKSEADDGVEVLDWGSPWTTTVAELIADRGWATVGFEDGTTTVATYNALKEAGVKLKPIGSALDALRRVKSADEVDYLREALRMTDEAFVAAESRADVGMTEKQLAEIVAEELRRVGSEGESFPTIVASGPNAAKPHHSPGDRTLQEGEPIIIDMGAIHKGYAGDLTRTIWFGEPSDTLREMYVNVKAAFDAAEAAAGPGMTGVEFDAAARSVFAEQGNDQYFVHSLGHGLGLRVHEAPSASKRSRDTLEAGNVVTIEPGLYVPDVGGVRIEDVVLITEDGAENLTRAPKREMPAKQE